MRSRVTVYRQILPTLLAGILMVPATAAAQKFGGLVAGVTNSDLSDAYGSANTDSRWGGTAGIIFGVRTYRATTISLEPAWIQRGGADIKTDYIEVPLIFGAAIRSANGTMRYGFYAGIAAAFKLGCSAEGVTFDPCDHLNGTDWMLPVGFRFLRVVGTSGTMLGVDARYAFPLERSFDNVDVGQRTWSFRLIYAKGIQ